MTVVEAGRPTVDGVTTMTMKVPYPTLIIEGLLLTANIYVLYPSVLTRVDMRVLKD
jgi:hypothetical protein